MKLFIAAIDFPLVSVFFMLYSIFVGSKRGNLIWKSCFLFVYIYIYIYISVLKQLINDNSSSLQDLLNSNHVWRWGMNNFASSHGFVSSLRFWHLYRLYRRKMLDSKRWVLKWQLIWFARLYFNLAQVLSDLLGMKPGWLRRDNGDDDMDKRARYSQF